jgi:hypothetical protein
MKLPNIEDLYKLSPVQHDVLTETVPVQAIYAIDGPLDHAGFKSAWEQAMSRHATLRTAFHSKGLEKPVQAVQQHAALPFADHNWESLPANEQSERFEAFVNEERLRGFELTRAPLMRLSLVRLANDVHPRSSFSGDGHERCASTLPPGTAGEHGIVQELHLMAAPTGSLTRGAVLERLATRLRESEYVRWHSGFACCRSQRATGSTFRFALGRGAEFCR